MISGGSWTVRRPGRGLWRAPYRVREAVGLLDAEHAECVLVGDSTTDVLAGHLAGVAVIGYADKPGKAQALAGVQAAAVTTDLADITTALRTTA
jgi:beta-phosphoglucomutase-like phosphatase (HAD superfamily)